MTPLLEIQALQVSVMSDEGPRHILHRVDLSVEEGGALAIVGESGSGKSMTLRAVTRTLPARAHVSGHVMLAGANVLELDDRALAATRTETIGMIFQDPRAAINPVHTVGDFLCEALVRSGRAGKEEATREAVRVLGDVGVTGPERRLHQYPHELSGGLLQRVMIASVILMRPRLVLADEPTTALDVTTQSDVMAILDEMRHDHGTALVLVTHDLELAAAVCDNTVVMYAGHVLEEQASEHLHADPLHPYTAALLASRPGAAGTGDLPVIPGRPKSASEVDQGCPFADRCRYVVDRCRSEPVSLWPAGSGRTACLRRDEILPLGQPGEESAQGERGMPDPLLEVNGLHKVYADRKGREQIAVSDVSFTLAETESLAIVGESGSGKTTVAKIIVGLESATAGLITIAGAKLSATGRPSRTDRMRRAKLVQMVFQDPFLSLDPRQTVHAGLDELIVLHHGSEQRSRRIADLLAQVGLGEREARARPRELSGGQRQRVAIARALVPEPRLLILDEAVAALDVSIQAQVLNVLRQIRSERGLSLLFITHDLSVVPHIAERTLVMHEGNVVDQGGTTELLDAPSHPYTRLLVSSIPRPGWRPSRRAASKEPTP